MGWYKVRVGQVIGQNGQDFRGGDLIELSERLAVELRDKVDACLADGTLVSTPAQVTEAQLDGVREHERVSILQAHVDQLQTQLEAARTALDAEVARQKAGARPKAPEAVKK